MIEIIDERGIPNYSRTRCQSEVGLATRRWRLHTHQDTRCQMLALYRLDGVVLCQRHCGDRLIERELISQALYKSPESN